MSLIRRGFTVFLSVTYSKLIGGGVCHLFIILSHLYIHELPTKYPREKVLENKKDVKDNRLLKMSMYLLNVFERV